MDPAILVIVGFTLLITLVLWIVTRRVGVRTSSRQAERFAQSLNAGPVEPKPTLGYKAATAGFEYAFDGRKGWVFARQLGRYLYFGVQFPTRSPLPLVVFRRETRWDRFGRAVFLNREVQTGDEAFDRAVYIETDERADAVKSLLADDSFRAAVLAAVQSPALRYGVVLSRDGVGAQYYPGVQPVSLERLRALAAAIGPVADTAPQLENPGVGTRANAHGDYLAVASYVGLAVGYLLHILVHGVRSDAWEPYHTRDADAAGGIAFIVYAVTVVVTFFWIRGHSRSLRNYLFVVIAGVFAIMGTVPYLLWAANALLDHSAATPHITTIRRKYTVSQRYHTQHRISYPAIYRPTGTDYQDVPRVEYDRAQVGDRFEVDVREGAFGWRWTSGTRVLDREPAQ